MATDYLLMLYTYTPNSGQNCRIHPVSSNNEWRNI